MCPRGRCYFTIKQSSSSPTTLSNAFPKHVRYMYTGWWHFCHEFRIKNMHCKKQNTKYHTECVRLDWQSRHSDSINKLKTVLTLCRLGRSGGYPLDFFMGTKMVVEVFWTRIEVAPKNSFVKPICNLAISMVTAR